MNMKLIPYGSPIPQNIRLLEEKFALTLPSDYKEFLTKFNGGNVLDACFYIKELNEFVLMGNFFGIGIEKGFSDINRINYEYSDIPADSILIGSDAGSGLLLLVCDEVNKGIWYYDHTYFFKASSDDLNTYFICETFTEMMEILKTTVLPKF